MDWEKLLYNVGLPGVMLMVIYSIAKLGIASWEKNQSERNKVEDKKADALTIALTSLSTKLDYHHTSELGWHNDNTRALAEIRGRMGIQQPEDFEEDEYTSPGGTRKQPRPASQPKGYYSHQGGGGK